MLSSFYKTFLKLTKIYYGTKFNIKIICNINPVNGITFSSSLDNFEFIILCVLWSDGTWTSGIYPSFKIENSSIDNISEYLYDIYTNSSGNQGISISKVDSTDIRKLTILVSSNLINTTVRERINVNWVYGFGIY